jgi:hypothetical protein
LYSRAASKEVAGGDAAARDSRALARNELGLAPALQTGPPAPYVPAILFVIRTEFAAQRGLFVKQDKQVDPQGYRCHGGDHACIGVSEDEFSHDDRRFQSIALSLAGRRLIPTLAAAADENDEQFFSVLHVGERDALLSVLKKLVRTHGLTKIPTE